MHDGMPYDRNQGQGQGHSREVDCQSPTGLIKKIFLINTLCVVLYGAVEHWVSGTLVNVGDMMICL